MMTIGKWVVVILTFPLGILFWLAWRGKTAQDKLADIELAKLKAQEKASEMYLNEK